MNFDRYQEIQTNRWERNAHKRRRWTPPEPKEAEETHCNFETSGGTGITVSNDSLTIMYNYEPNTEPTGSTNFWTYPDNSVLFDATTSGTSATRSSVIVDPGIILTSGSGSNGSSIPFMGGTCNPELFKKEQLKRKLKEQWVESMPLNHRQAIMRAAKSAANFNKVPQAELVALQLLKKMLTKDEWVRYLKHGFIVVCGVSGLEYQIIRGQDHIHAFRKGQKVAELCVSGQQSIPLTDRVISKKIIIECNEQDIWHRANIYARNNKTVQQWDRYKIVTEQELQQIAA